jgi:hypothetical protein
MRNTDQIRRPQARAIAIAADQQQQEWAYRHTLAFLVTASGALWVGLGLMAKILF